METIDLMCTNIAYIGLKNAIIHCLGMSHCSKISRLITFLYMKNIKLCGAHYSKLSHYKGDKKISPEFLIDQNRILIDHYHSVYLSLL